MCGICGVISKNQIDTKTLDKMNSTMKHRGPNDCGRIIKESDELNIGFAHCRLSILDLSQNGHQPMWNNEKSNFITYNGELYNYLELKEYLFQKGYCFYTNCDTEVLLACYDYWGEECVYHFNGMYAFAIFDLKKKRLFMARDPLGKKPLYYYYDKNNFVFGSELKPIMKYPYFIKKIEESVLAEFLYHGYISGEKSIFEQVKKLKPGNYLILEKNIIKEKIFWNLDKKFNQNKIELFSDFQEAKFSLKQELQKSVKKRLISDVPVGTFLSGGIDSTLISAIAQQNSTKKIKTYSIGFDEKKYNEAEHSKKIAEYIGTDHNELYISSDKMINLVQSMPRFFDEPFGDSSSIPTMLVSQFAKKDVTVVLSGDGADELFCGYTTYDYVKKAYNLRYITKIANKFIFNSNLEKKVPNKLLSAIKNQEKKYATQIPNVLHENIVNLILKNRYKNPFFNENQNIENWQERRMLLDIKTYLPDDILTKVDRASMRYSLEARCPFLDKNVVEMSFRIPHSYKYFNREKKHILKEITYDYVPKNLLNRPKKGFSVPLYQWLNRDLKELLYEITNSNFIKKQSLFNYNNLILLFNMLEKEKTQNIEKIVWNYLMFQLWYKEYIEK